MDTWEAINERRSVRLFTEQEVSHDQLEDILKGACMAPSAGNLQPWHFIVVRDPQVKEELADAALGQKWMLTAPVIIVVCAEHHRAARGYGSRGTELYCLQDTAAAAQNILLGAFSLGLATCWVGAFNEEAAARVLGLKSQVRRPVAMIPIGYPGEANQAPERMPLEKVVTYVK